MALAFDQVRVGSEDGERRLSAAEFLELPLHERVQILVGGAQLRFFRNGSPVDRNVALKSMRG